MSIKYTFVSTDGGKCDIVTVSKDLLKNASMSVDVFEDLFFDATKTSATYMEAYEKVEVIHEQLFEKRRYSDYDSFRKVKERRVKK